MKLKPCPFCGCSMRIKVGTYLDGSPMNELRGWHDDDCPLSVVSWYTYPEDGWTEENLAERWNKRIYD